MRNLLDLEDRVGAAAGATSGSGRTIVIGRAEHGADAIRAGWRPKS